MFPEHHCYVALLTLSKLVYCGTRKPRDVAQDKQDGFEMCTASSHTGVRMNQQRQSAAEHTHITAGVRGLRLGDGWVAFSETVHNTTTSVAGCH